MNILKLTTNLIKMTQFTWPNTKPSLWQLQANAFG
ncbi:hypothetical protein F383_09784 [Gossypium arboreum]|uniref:Uncharacterized protein n=1 Tax=Gossypium arboreum TaxID=29729 RepID=A0A0B0PEK4_GOSAR|nr:hypothetical protein F383_09784 [Gossypium arboreum]